MYNIIIHILDVNNLKIIISMMNIYIYIYKQKNIIWTYIYQLSIPPNMGDDKNLDMNC
jgi:hypothetical protein